MGVAVFSGMLGVTFFGLVLTPVFYVVLQGMLERRARMAQQFALQPAHDEDSKHA
jgi:multidrug efflux pump